MSNVILGTWACANPCSVCGGTCNSWELASTFAGAGFFGNPGSSDSTSNPNSVPLGIPTGCNPVIYLVTAGQISAAAAPYLYANAGSFAISGTFSWTYTITYDGVTIYSEAGSSF